MILNLYHNVADFLSSLLGVWTLVWNSPSLQLQNPLAAKRPLQNNLVNMEIPLDWGIGGSSRHEGLSMWGRNFFLWGSHFLYFFSSNVVESTEVCVWVCVCTREMDKTGDRGYFLWNTYTYERTNTQFTHTHTADWHQTHLGIQFLVYSYQIASCKYLEFFIWQILKDFYFYWSGIFYNLFLEELQYEGINTWWSIWMTKSFLFRI